MRDDQRFEIQSAFDLLPHVIGLSVYPKEKNFEEIINYLKKRNAVELQKINAGKNPEVEKRYDRYVDYG